MRTNLMHSETIIAATARMEDLQRDAATADMLIRAAQLTHRARPYAVTIGRMLVQIGTRLQAMAGQPA